MEKTSNNDAEIMTFFDKVKLQRTIEMTSQWREQQDILFAKGREQQDISFAKGKEIVKETILKNVQLNHWVIDPYEIFSRRDSFDSHQFYEYIKNDPEFERFGVTFWATEGWTTLSWNEKKRDNGIFEKYCQVIERFKLIPKSGFCCVQVQLEQHELPDKEVLFEYFDGDPMFKRGAKTVHTDEEGNVWFQMEFAY